MAGRFSFPPGHPRDAPHILRCPSRLVSLGSDRILAPYPQQEEEVWTF